MGPGNGERRKTMASATSDYLKPISFLVADDRAYMRRVIKNILETLGCKRIDEAHHGGPGLDPRSLPKGFRPRDMVDPTLKVEPIHIKTRDFR